MATEVPNPSSVVVPEPSSSAVCVQPDALLENTYALPVYLACPTAPTMMLEPEMATDHPK